ncbi:MAG: FliM/FliN family flagellar motor switch protein [Planctomycetes bacterium]|nr:FliM/FliN family flagellar motor switch protein [Planctomycetota bacterium]MBL7143505.1 FliM/FliN family flagellar motor switch protein [Phycisphaerae bacterium]
MSGANNLSKEKIHQLLIAVGSGPLEDTTGIKASEFNWNEPHYFDRKQLNRLDDFTKRVARSMSVKFVDFCHSEFNVTVVSTEQHFAAKLVDQAMESGQNDYYLAFGNDQKHPCGLISIPTQTAFIWATQLLGDTESEVEDSGRDLSQLEESLLLDLLSALIQAFSQKNWDFQPGRNMARRLFPIEFKGTEELCKITFDVKKTGQEKGSEAYILILCSKLESVVGKAEQAVGSFSADDISKAILGHMQKMPVYITAQLASTVLTLKEIMSLEVGDILLLDKKVNEPIELITSGRTALLGRPARLAGKNAVVITEIFNDRG